MDPGVDRAVAFLHQHMRERITNTMVAAAVGVSPAHLYRIFQRELKCTPHQFLRRLRVEEAERLLAMIPKPSLMTAARAVGLKKAWSLAQAFRTVKGHRPGSQV